MRERLADREREGERAREGERGGRARRERRGGGERERETERQRERKKRLGRERQSRGQRGRECVCKPNHCPSDLLEYLSPHLDSQGKGRIGKEPMNLSLCVQGLLVRRDPVER
jgi:hypothetical protein